MSSSNYDPIIKNFSGQTAIVLGGHSGIGLRVVRALYEQGARVISIGLTPVHGGLRGGNEKVVARTVKRITTLRQKRMMAVDGDAPRFVPEFIEADVTARMGNGELELVNILKQLGEKHPRIDMLVDSIGYSPRMPWAELTSEIMKRADRVNADYLPVALRSLVPAMAQGGRVVVVGSTMLHGLKDVSGLTYAGAKAKRLAISLGMAAELGKSGIDLCVVSPSHTPTENETRIVGTSKAEVTHQNAIKGRINQFDLRAEDVARFIMVALSPECAPMLAGAEHLLASQKGMPLLSLGQKTELHSMRGDMAEIMRDTVARLAEASRASGEARAANLTLTRENQTLRQENAELQAEYNMTRAANDRLNAQHAASGEELSRLREELAAARGEISRLQGVSDGLVMAFNNITGNQPQQPQRSPGSVTHLAAVNNGPTQK